MQKAVFFDIDGTIIDKYDVLPESAVTAIRQLRANGHYAFLCSGRTKCFITPRLLDIGFDGIVGGCGTHVEFQGKDLIYTTIDHQLLKDTVAMVKEYGLPIVMEGKHNLFMDEEDFTHDDYGRFMLRIMGKHVLPVTGMEDRWEVSKLSLLLPNPKWPDLMERFADDYTFLVHGGHVMEVVPKGYSKGNGIAQLCQRLGIDQADTFAFGDSINDKDMLEFVNTGIAMGNATPETKEVADYVTTAVLEDGLMNGLKHFGLI